MSTDRPATADQEPKVYGATPDRPGYTAVMTDAIVKSRIHGRSPWATVEAIGDALDQAGYTVAARSVVRDARETPPSSEPRDHHEANGAPHGTSDRHGAAEGTEPLSALRTIRALQAVYATLGVHGMPGERRIFAQVAEDLTKALAGDLYLRGTGPAPDAQGPMVTTVVIRDTEAADYDRICDALVAIGGLDWEARLQTPEQVTAEKDQAVRDERQRLAAELHQRAEAAPPLSALRRHMGMAARFVAPEPTGEEIAQAIADGNFVVCDIPDDPGRGDQ